MKDADVADVCRRFETDADVTGSPYHRLSADLLRAVHADPRSKTLSVGKSHLMLLFTFDEIRPEGTPGGFVGVEAKSDIEFAIVTACCDNGGIAYLAPPDVVDYLFAELAKGDWRKNQSPG